jgi:hypothetical protein
MKTMEKQKFETYAEQLKNPKWINLRNRMLEKNNYKCQECNSLEKQLFVHHKKYVKGRKAWQYHEDLLEVLCEECHFYAHHCFLCEEKVTEDEKEDEKYPTCHKKCYSEWIEFCRYHDYLDSKIIFSPYWDYHEVDWKDLKKGRKK